MNNKTYLKIKDKKIWKIVDEAISELVKNRDIQEKTSRDYIVGYLCQKIDKYIFESNSEPAKNHPHKSGSGEKR